MSSRSTDREGGEREHAAEWAEVATSSALLIRSRTEIVRELGELLRKETMLATDVARGRHLFLTQLVQVDGDDGTFAIAYSEDSVANDMLLAAHSLTFRANRGAVHVEFGVGPATDAVFQSRGCARFALPLALLKSQRRQHPRMHVPSTVSLRCVADGAGIMPFESRIVDVSLGGLGGLIYDAQIRLDPGTVLKGCKIILPGGDAVLADLEVRYTMRVTLPDGRLASRSGVRFVNRPKEIDALIDVFVRDLDAHNE